MGSRTIIVAVFLFFSLINIAPMMMFDIGGDSAFQKVLIDCFGSQFWDGDFYPRWCMEANAGLGAPLMLFYFPLPYYVSSLLYPLTSLGLSLDDLYIVCILLVTLVSALTCYSWLKDITIPARAVLVTLLFLFMPYRMEAELYRSAYAELWGIAFLPLLFKYTRLLAQGEKFAWLGMAGAFGLLLLSHLPCAALAGIACVIYLLMMTEKWLPKLCAFLALSWGVLLAAFYLVPAFYYKQFMVRPDEIEEQPWANRFLTVENVTELGQGRVVAMVMIMALALAIFCMYILLRARDIDDRFIRREAGAWTVISLVALFLLLPVSGLFYESIGPLSQVVFPWRMQSAFMLSMTFLLAAWMQCFVTERRLKTWRADFTLFMALMVLMSYFVVGVRTDESGELSARVVATHYATQPEYRTIWTDTNHFNQSYIFTRPPTLAERVPVEVVIGAGEGTVTYWAWNGIVLKAQSELGMTVRLDHAYFPLWSATTEEGRELPLKPESGAGRMLLDIPPGSQRITLHYDVAEPLPWLMHSASIASLLAFALLLWRIYHSRHHILGK